MCRPLRPLALLFAFAVLVSAARATDEGARVTGGGAAKPQELKLFRVLLVIDTESNLATSVQKDRDHLRTVLEDYIPEGRRKIDLLEGTKVTRDEILRYYRDLKTGPDEALLFFYAGHGCLDSKLGQCLQPQMGETSLVPRSEVRKAMEQKGAGLVVLLTDCCSTSLRAIPPPPDIRERTQVKLHPVLRCLFFQHRGTVDVTAAEDNFGSYGDAEHGGVFTGALVHLLVRDLKKLTQDRDGFLSWKEFFPQLSQETEKHFIDFANRARAKGEHVKQKTQRPRSFALPEHPMKRLESEGRKTFAVISIRNDSGKAISYRYRWSGEREWKIAKVARTGTAFYNLPLTDATKLPSLEIVAESGMKGKASLKPAKWSGAGRPAYRDGKEYRISPESARTASRESEADFGSPLARSWATLE